MRHARGDLIDQCEALVARAEAAHRDLTNAEQSDFNRLMAQSRALDLDIARQETAEVTRADMTGPNAYRFPGHGNPTSPLLDVRALNRARGETFASRARASWTGDTDPQDMDLGRYLRGCVTGRFDRRDIDYQNTASVSQGSNLGWLLSSPLSAMVLDKIVASTVVAESGAMVLPMESNTLDVARITGLPTAQFKAENAAASFSDLSVGRLQFTSRMLVGLTRCSIELFEDAPNAGEVISNALATSLALEADRAALLGTGAGSEPIGLALTPGVNSTAISRALVTDDLLDAVTAIRNRNIIPSTLLWNPTTAGNFEKLKSGEGEYLSLQLPQIVADLAKRTSTQITSTYAFVGDFSKFAMAMRTELTVEVSRDAAESGTYAFTQGQVWIRAYLRMDCGALYEDAFQVLTGLS